MFYADLGRTQYVIQHKVPGGKVTLQNALN